MTYNMEVNVNYWSVKILHHFFCKESYQHAKIINSILRMKIWDEIKDLGIILSTKLHRLVLALFQKCYFNTIPLRPSVKYSKIIWDSLYQKHIFGKEMTHKRQTLRKHRLLSDFRKNVLSCFPGTPVK